MLFLRVGLLKNNTVNWKLRRHDTTEVGGIDPV
jgi:hypothetical protein